ncbi:MAG: PAS domain-containing sensor histidine kinase [Peptostreptococcus stomatis]|uniref:sensor histidine kinase n=1 Tax=Peptostreptococcus stomatis TaxID=341694 RepID=UPI001A4AF537|nr:ATP-binding protein [Peptostreptococcus stomatis]MBL6464810.1 PAS domain-containing sensor histidine kinase [Peptostreptococcus stomatis]
MDKVMYVLVVTMLISWLVLILYWRYVQAFKAFMRDLNRASYRIKKKDFSVRIRKSNNTEVMAFVNNFNSTLSSLDKSFYDLDNKNRQLDAIIKSVSNGIIVIDINKRVYLINSVARDYIDFRSSGKLEGMPISSIVKNDELLDFIVYNAGMSTSVSKEIKDTSGRIFKVKIDPVKMHLEKDLVISSVINIEDISERIRLENIRRDFAANVSHELKTPLTSIQGFIETLKVNDDNIEPATRKRFLDIIDNESSRLRILINDILMLSSIEGDIVLSLEKVDLKKENKKILDLFEDKMVKKQVNIYFEYNGLERIQTHREYYKELMINLISNAIKYNRPGGYVKVSFFEDEDNYRICIEDNGIGIGEGEQERIFERFYRVTKSRNKEIDGTGLGLAIVKHIILSLGGDIGLESVLGQGSKFKISLPKNQ